MQTEKIFIEGPLLIKPAVFADQRGYFYEPYNKQRFADAGIIADFVQDNQSMSNIAIVRGLHFQAPPFEQGKLVRVVRGSVMDIVVDIRKDSPTYGKHFDIELSESNFIQLWIPPGFAHGFSVLENNTIFEYKCTNYYQKSSEGGIHWNDPDLGINWGVLEPIVSNKDNLLPFWKNFVSPF